jgi:hypothetical protein
MAAAGGPSLPSTPDAMYDAAHAAGACTGLVVTGITPPSRPGARYTVQRRRCSCGVLRDMIKNTSVGVLFSRFKAPALGEMFMELAALQSTVYVENVGLLLTAGAALLFSGQVVCWGGADGQYGSRAVAAHLTDGVVRLTRCTTLGMIAIKKDRRVVTWEMGRRIYQGTMVAPPAVLDSGVLKIVDAFNAVAVHMENGRVATWGINTYGGDSTAVADRLVDVVDVVARSFGFLALTRDGKVVTWGRGPYPAYTGPPESVLSGNYIKIFSNRLAFAALKGNGQLESWGHNGMTKVVDDVASVVATSNAFAAMKENGHMESWGWDGMLSRRVGKRERAVKSVVATDCSFALLKRSGKVICWAGADMPGRTPNDLTGELHFNVVSMGADPIGVRSNSASVNNILHILDEGVECLAASFNAFAAVKGNVVHSWGIITNGAEYVTVTMPTPVVDVTGHKDGSFTLRCANDQLFSWRGRCFDPCLSRVQHVPPQIPLPPPHAPAGPAAAPEAPVALPAPGQAPPAEESGSDWNLSDVEELDAMPESDARLSRAMLALRF